MSTLEVGKVSGATVQTSGKQHGAVFQGSLFLLSDSCSIVPCEIVVLQDLNLKAC